jgi:cell wall-associated NlpC family hydrolase
MIGRLIADAARTFVGTPFVHQGRQPGVGLDCAGVVLCAAWEAGLTLPEVADYGRLPKVEHLVASLGERARAVEVGYLAPGDVLLFAWRSGQPAHFAVWDEGCIVHAYESAGRTLLQQFAAPWRARLQSCWRLRGAD